MQGMLDETNVENDDSIIFISALTSILSLQQLDLIS